MVEIEAIIFNINSGRYYYSRHADDERLNDELSLKEVEEAIRNGRILEQYPDTGRGESCLVAGFTGHGKPIHVVCGVDSGGMTIITVYIPGPPKFINAFQRGEK